MIEFFLLVNFLVWAVQTTLDIKLKHIHPLVSIPALLSIAFIGFEVSLISFGMLSLAPILYFTDYTAVGDTTLYLTYIISTLPAPILGLQTLLIGTGTYILFQETILKNQGYPMAPGFLLSLTPVYIHLLLFTV